jgi:hypothetical protein
VVNLLLQIRQSVRGILMEIRYETKWNVLIKIHPESVTLYFIFLFIYRDNINKVRIL